MPEDKVAARIFKTAWFKRFTRRKKISDKALKEAIIRAEKGTIDADLGGYVLNSGLQGPVMENLADTGQSSFLKKEIKLFLFMGLQKVHRKTSTRPKQTRSKKPQRNY